MNQKKDNLLEKRLKWKFKKKLILGCLIPAVLFLIPFILIVSMFGGMMTSASDSVVADYKTAAEAAGCSWQELLAFDTVRYENDFENADPFQSALEFISVYYEKYRKVIITKPNGSTETKWVLDKKGWFSTPDAIRGFFGLQATADVTDVTSAAKGYTKPEYVISISAKDIEDVMDEHGFDQDQREWIGSLITEGILNEMFGEEYELPDFITAGNGYFGWPAPGNTRVTCEYGARVLDGEREFHYGVDIGAAVGSPVVAIEDGVVISTGPHLHIGITIAF